MVALYRPGVLQTISVLCHRTPPVSCPQTMVQERLEHTKALLADTLEMEQFCPLDDLGLSGPFHRKKQEHPENSTYFQTDTLTVQ